MKLVSALAAMVLLAMTVAPSAQAIVTPTPNGPAPGSQIYFVASLQDANPEVTSPHYCGGVLIAPNWVITAKWCTEGRKLESIAVRSGSMSRSSGGELVTVSGVVPHPTRDAALVQLSTPVRAAPVVVADAPGPVGTTATVLGWGQTCPSNGCGDLPDELQGVESVTEPDSVCAVGEDRICTRYPHGGGPCFGDEGGPLVTRVDGVWYLTGLVPSPPRFVTNCAQNLTALINVTDLRGWIRQHTGA